MSQLRTLPWGCAALLVAGAALDLLGESRQLGYLDPGIGTITTSNVDGKTRRSYTGAVPYDLRHTFRRSCSMSSATRWRSSR